MDAPREEPLVADEPTGRQLWEEAVEGSSGSFGMLFDRHAKAVYNHCFRLTASWSETEDATQATFLTAWRKRDRVRLERDDAHPWLLAIATNVTLSQRRSARRWLNLLNRRPRDRHTDDHADEASDRVDDERKMSRLIALARRLLRPEREALALVVWSGVSYAEAATTPGIAEASVRSRAPPPRPSPEATSPGTFSQVVGDVFGGGCIGVRVMETWRR